MLASHPSKEQRGADTFRQDGFTLIELLIVIVVLGILAAVVVFALGSVTSKSAASACNADAKTVETAIAVFQTQNPGSTVTSSALVGTSLKSWPTNGTHYAISIGTTSPNVGSVMIAVPSTATPVSYDTANPCGSAT